MSAARGRGDAPSRRHPTAGHATPLVVPQWRLIQSVTWVILIFVRTGREPIDAIGYMAIVLTLLLLSLLSAGVADAAGNKASWELTPPSYDFGTRLPGSGPSPSKKFTLTNTGEIELTANELGRAEGGEGGSNGEPFVGEPFVITEDTCGNLAPGASCSIEVAFDPSIGGSMYGFISVGDSAQSLQATAKLTGQGAEAKLAITPPFWRFAPRQIGSGSSAPISFKVTDYGSLSLSITGLSIMSLSHFVPGQFELDEGTCAAGTRLEPGASCTLEIAFSPTIPVEFLNYYLRVEDKGTQTMYAELLGTGEPAAASIEPPSTLPSGFPAEAKIVHHPRRHTRRRSAVFRFDGSPTTAQFKCGLDSHALAPCQSPIDYKNLRVGWHSFTIQAVAESGLISGAPERYRWRVLPNVG